MQTKQMAVILWMFELAKYDPLNNELVRNGRPTIVMSFKELERLVGPLPATCYANRWWWGNEDNSVKHYAQCRSWAAAGYRALVELQAQKVTFCKR